MTSCDSYIIKIVKSSWKLWLDKWVSWWSHLTGNAIRLKAINTSSNKINVISPSSYNWISFDRSTWNSFICERFFKSFPCFCVCNFLTIWSSTNTCTFTNKSILSYTWGISASICCFNSSPVVIFTLWTLSSMES